MASIEKRSKSGRTRWYARYRDPQGEQRAKAFDRRIDAERFLAKTEGAKITGTYIDLKAAARSFASVAEEHWQSYAHLLAEDTTRLRKRSVLNNHILPVLGRYPIGSIKPSTMGVAVATWSQSLAPGTVGQVLRQVRQIFDAAVADGLVASNPAKLVRAPSAPRRRDVHLSDDQIRAIVNATPDDYRPLTIALVGLGLRISEACGLRVADVDFLRRMVHVRQQRRPGGMMGQLKTGSSARDIPADERLLDVLAEQIQRRPRPDGLIFSSITGKALTKAVAGHVFDGIERDVEFIVSPHSLRHYFGASLISNGVSVVAVSRWLGHSSPEITWRVYSYLMARDEDAGRAALAKTVASAVSDVYPMCTSKRRDG